MRRDDSSSPRSNPDSRQYHLPQDPHPSGSHPAPASRPTGSEAPIPFGLDPSDPSSSSPSIGPDRPMTAVRAATSSESLIGPSARRYQPYLSSLNTDRRTWAVPQYAASGAAAASGLALESPLSAGDSPSIPSQMTPVAYSTSGQQPSSYETAPASGAVTGYFYSTVPRGSTTGVYPSGSGVPGSDYASQPRALANYIPAPTYGVASPPHAGAAGYPSPTYPRRHTVSHAFQQAASAFPGNQVELEDVMVKEEKRRRNKESSQRFRDRTRERQREKQERLDYLERRVKDLEVQLKAARSSSGVSPPMGQPGSSSDSESVQSALQRLQKENEGLRSALKTAETEIVRLRPLVGGSAVFPPHSQMYHQPQKLSPDSGSYQDISQTPSPVGPAEPSSSYFARGMPAPGPPEGYAPIPQHPGRMQVDYPFSDTRAEASSGDAPHHSGQQPLQPQPIHSTSHSAIMGWAEGTHHSVHDPSATIPEWEKGLPGRSDPGPPGSQ